MIAPTHDELLILESLRAHRRKQRQQIDKAVASHILKAPAQLTLGQKISDAVAHMVGSWRFIIV